eukprot:TRINITY_DN2241_c0_g2_i2.p1 TRINITY_DN2241_c0_g2~~TRINITY_DN2241_c0_g2_i2.p1  ORF type:complete len:742 (-),score=106.05 TRINITY_DN2241_c0_g2_i2:221-2446(-)
MPTAHKLSYHRSSTQKQPSQTGSSGINAEYGGSRMKGYLILLFICGISFANACDYNIASVADVINALNDQNSWNTVPTLCFAPGLYNFTLQNSVLKSQKWVGPQAGVDPTCGRLVVPGCARLTSASSLDHSVEAIIVGTAVSLVPSGPISFSFDGFVFYNPSYTYPIFEELTSAATTTINNTYVDTTYLHSTYSVIDRSYFRLEYADSTQAFLPSIFHTETTITNSFFNKMDAHNGNNGTVTAIGNTFSRCALSFKVHHGSHFEDNSFLYCSSGAIVDYSGNSVYKKNLFWLVNTAVSIVTSNNITLDMELNCFIGNTIAVHFGYSVLGSQSIYRNNFFGHKYGPSAFTTAGVIRHWLPSIYANSAQDIDVTAFSNIPISSFQAPNACPRLPFSISAQPQTINLEDSFTATYVLNDIDPALISSGVTKDWFAGLSGNMYVFSQNGRFWGTQGNPLNWGGWDASTQQNGTVVTQASIASRTIPYQMGASQYWVGLWFSFANNMGPLTSIIFSPITINIVPTAECYNKTKGLTVNKSLRNSGPLTLGLLDLGCTSQEWWIKSVNQSSIYSWSNYAIQMNIPANFSGVRPVHYQITPVGSNSPYHNVITQIEIINSSPVINSATFTWGYPRTAQTFPNWNLLSGCSDADGDTLSVVQITRSKARSANDVIQLDPFTLYFKPEKAVLSVTSDGSISLTSPANTNPVTAGAPLALFWNKDLSFQFQITDGDVTNQFAWGTANVNSN